MIFKHTKPINLLTFIVLTATTLTTPALSQGTTEHWDVSARQKSQNLHSHGMTLLTNRQIEAAINDFRQGTLQDPTDSACWSALGMGLAMQGNYQEALDALQKSFTLRQSQETLLSTGIVHYLSHDYEAAITSFNRILEANPNACHILGDLGWGYMRKGDLQSAQDSFEKLTKCSPNSQFGFHGLANVKYLQGDFSGARQAAERAEAIKSYPPVVLLLARLDFLQGDRTAGEKHVRAFINQTRRPFQQRTMTAIGYPGQHDFRWDPYLADNLDNGYLLLARVQNLPRNTSRQRSLSRQGKAAAVISKDKELLATDGKDYHLTRELGLAQLAQGDYPGAIDSFKTALEVSPTSRVDLLHLGRALDLAGKQTEACANIRLFQQQCPNQKLSPTFSEIANIDPAVTYEEVKTVHHRSIKPIQQPKGIPASDF